MGVDTSTLQEVDARRPPDQGRPEAITKDGPPWYGPTSQDPPDAVTRSGSAVILATLSATVLVAGVFEGIAAHLYGAIAAVAGGLLALFVRRWKRPLLIQAGTFGGIFLIGVVFVMSFGAG